MLRSNLDKTILTFLFCCVIIPAFGKVKLISGPMQGHTTHTSMKIWLMVKNADSLSIVLLDNVAQVQHTQRVKINGNFIHKNYSITSIEFSGLKPATAYQCKVKINNDVEQESWVVKTYPENDTASFSFLLGSCAIAIPDLFKSMHPGNEEKIFNPMLLTPSEFMLWLGDYLYYVFFQHRSYKTMVKSHISQRKGQKLNLFLTSRAQYAIWDDHDYGPDDGDGTWELKDTSLKVFKHFWPNAYYGTDSAAGVFFHFKYADAEFFMTDNRYHRSAVQSEEPNFFGKKQLGWLKERLEKSEATFKFIAVGNQVLNTVSKAECYYNYTDEKKELFDFISEKKITGVIFLSGDRHFTELMKVDRNGDYPFYEFTSSPLTSIGGSKKRVMQIKNPHTIPGTFVIEQNYGRINISGEKGNRKCLMETYDRFGDLVWKHEIEENELK